MEWLAFLALIAIVGLAFAIVGVPKLFFRMRQLQERMDILERYQLQRTTQTMSNTIQPIHVQSPNMKAEHDSVDNITVNPWEKHDETQQEQLNVITPIGRALGHSESANLTSMPWDEHEKTTQSFIPTSLEQILGGKFLLWVGALAMFLAGIFLVNYWIDQGYITPPMRMVFAAILGSGMYGLSWWLDKKIQTNIPDMVAGIGVAILYAVILASRYYYQWLGVEVTFLFLLFANALLFIRTWQSHEMFGYFGVILCYVTPLLVNSPDHDYIMLNGYLVFLSATLCILAATKPQTKYIDLLSPGHLVWSIVLLVGIDHDTPQYTSSLYGMLVAGAIFWFAYTKTASQTFNSINRFNSLSAAIMAGLWIFGAKTDYNQIFWASEAFTLIGFTAAAYLQSNSKPMHIGMLAIGLISIVVGYHTAPENYLFGSSILLACAIPSLLTIQGELFDPAKRASAIAIAGGSALIWLASFWHTGVENNIATSIALLGPLQAINLAFAVWQTRCFFRTDAYENYSYWSSALFLCVGCSLATILDSYWWALSLCVTAVLCSMIYRRYAHAIHLNQIFVCVVGVFIIGTILACEQLLGPMLNNFHLIAAPMIWMVLPTAILFSLHKYLSAEPEYAKYQDKILTALMLLGMSGLFWQGHALLNGLIGDHFDGYDAYHIGALLTAGLAYIWLMLRLQQLDSESILQNVTQIAGIIIVVLATFIPGFVLNPWLDSVQVGAVPIFNALWFLYGLPGLFLGLLSYLLVPNNTARMGTIMRGIALLWTFGLVLSLIRQYFHGSVFYGTQANNTELYCYSLGMGFYGLLLLWAGIVRQKKLLRLSALLILTLTSFKVFLWDLSKLAGTYRFISFFALGATLMSIGYIYQKTDIGRKSENE